MSSECLTRSDTRGAQGWYEAEVGWQGGEGGTGSGCCSRKCFDIYRFNLVHDNGHWWEAMYIYPHLVTDIGGIDTGCALMHHFQPCSWLWTLLGSHVYPHQLTDVGGVHTGGAMPFSTLFMTVNTFGKPWISTPVYRCWRCSHRWCYAIFLSLCDKTNGGIKTPIQRHPLNRPSP